MEKRLKEMEEIKMYFKRMMEGKGARVNCIPNILTSLLFRKPTSKPDKREPWEKKKNLLEHSVQ